MKCEGKLIRKYSDLMSRKDISVGFLLNTDQMRFLLTLNSVSHSTREQIPVAVFFLSKNDRKNDKCNFKVRFHSLCVIYLSSKLIPTLRGLPVHRHFE
jgi:hypothetical protein